MQSDAILRKSADRHISATRDGKSKGRKRKEDDSHTGTPLGLRSGRIQKLPWRSLIFISGVTESGECNQLASFCWWPQRRQRRRIRKLHELDKAGSCAQPDKLGDAAMASELQRKLPRGSLEIELSVDSS